ncbi:unnamed protein product [Moneuplotes crassus]|uniref:Uncharacterized protein n=1 Tax=Euplotes crassus TaxID=5936 RepID=A0AAD1UK98_EUPCR|nr:unnamed protein product [Moneuplotes crassus]
MSQENLKILVEDNKQPWEREIQWDSPSHKTSKFLRLCKEHGAPLIFLANNKVVCEHCSESPKIDLKKQVFQLLKDLEHNVYQYNIAISNASKLRTVDLRENILEDIHQYFIEVRSVTDKIEQEKINEVEHIFKTLEFSKLDDLQEFYELQNTGEKALETVKEMFRNLALANVYNYRISYNGIIDHISEMTEFLKNTTKVYHEKCNTLFRIQKDQNCINNGIKKAIDAMCQSFGSLAKPKEEIDSQMRDLCKAANMDYLVIEKINKNTDMMSPAEQETVFNSLNAIKVQTKDLILNHSGLSNYGIEVICESLKNSDHVHRLDLSYISNPIDSSGSKAISEMLKANLYLKSLNLAGCGIKDKTLMTLCEGINYNRTLEILILDKNEITTIGLKSLLSILSNEKRDQNLVLLDIGNNYIDDIGAKAIAEMLKVNHKLSKLYLHFNELSNKGLIAISHALEENLALEQCYVYGNSITEEIQILAKIKHKNRILMKDTLL